MSKLVRLTAGVLLGIGLITGTAHPDDTCALRGKVVSSVDGTPLGGAMVQVSGERAQSTMTSTEGAFVFPSLKPGDFAVQAIKPGYFTASQLNPSSVPAFHIRVDASTGPVVLKLIPEGVVSGRILDENGEPVEGMQVWLQPTKASASSTTVLTKPSNGLETNEIGEYRIAGVRPGSYLLIASGEQGPQMGWQEGFTEESEAVRQTERSYPITYYPGTLSRSQAIPIQVKAGTAQRLEIRVAKQPLYRIAGRVEAVEAAERVRLILISPANRGPSGMARMTGDGSFVIPQVSPGEYLLVAAADSSGGRME